MDSTTGTEAPGILRTIIIPGSTDGIRRTMVETIAASTIHGITPTSNRVGQVHTVITRVTIGIMAGEWTITITDHRTTHGTRPIVHIIRHGIRHTLHGTRLIQVLDMAASITIGGTTPGLRL